MHKEPDYDRVAREHESEIAERFEEKFPLKVIDIFTTDQAGSGDLSKDGYIKWLEDGKLNLQNIPDWFIQDWVDEYLERLPRMWDREDE